MGGLDAGGEGEGKKGWSSVMGGVNIGLCAWGACNEAVVVTGGEDGRRWCFLLLLDLEGFLLEAVGLVPSPARLSRSSMRCLIFLPGSPASSVHGTFDMGFLGRKIQLTIVALGDPVLNAAALCKIRYLGPVLIRVC